MSWFSRQGCCQGDCTACTRAPREWVADFGAGGWNNYFCSECTTYSGEITLSNSGLLGFPSPTCNYSSLACQIGNVCCAWRGPLNPSSVCTYCAYNDGTPTLVLHRPSSAGTSWFYMLWVWLSQDLGATGSKVVYSSASSTATRCLDDADPDTGKITLSKDSEVHTGLACTGTLPATVDIWPA